MENSSSESIIMTLLEQVRCLEDERDKALELAKNLNEKLNSKQNVVSGSGPNIDSGSPGENLEDTLKTLVTELEEIRNNEEQRQFNLSQLSKQKKSDEESLENNGDKKMVELCKQYYGKIVTELQQEKKSLQNKVEAFQSELIEKDMQIAELQLKQGTIH